MGFITVLICWIIVIIVVVVTIIIVLLMVGRKRIYIEHNLPLCINLIPEFTEGHSMGLERNSIKRKNGRTLVEFIPMDIFFRDNMWEQPKIHLQRMIVGAGHRIPLPRGELSGQRETVFYIPKDKSNLSKRLENTMLGQVIGDSTVMLKIINNVMAGVREGDKVQATLMREWGKGEISRDYYNKMKEIAMELRKQLILLSTMPETKPKPGGG